MVVNVPHDNPSQPERAKRTSCLRQRHPQSRYDTPRSMSGCRTARTIIRANKPRVYPLIYQQPNDTRLKENDACSPPEPKSVFILYCIQRLTTFVYGFRSGKPDRERQHSLDESCRPDQTTVSSGPLIFKKVTHKKLRLRFTTYGGSVASATLNPV